MIILLKIRDMAKPYPLKPFLTLKIIWVAKTENITPNNLVLAYHN